MNKRAILEYVRTVIIALIFALVLAGVATACSKVIAEHHSRMLARISNTTKDNELIGFLITKYQQDLAKTPGDYTLNVKLGNLYELLFSYRQAEEQYQKAMNKAPYGVYSPYFGMANLYIKMGKYNQAQKIVKQLKNTDHAPLLIAKGDFYMNLGDALWEEEKYEDSVNQYKIAFFFYKKVDSSKSDTAISGIIDCYNKLADIEYENNNVDGAVESLETALLYKESPFLYYKLALLYKDFNPVEANHYMEKTFEADPGLINYNLYEDILVTLANYYYQSGQDVEKELYLQKLKNIKSFQKRYVITEKDVKINIKSIKLKDNLFHTKKNLTVKFTIENTSKNDFNTLLLNAKLSYDDKNKEIYSTRLYSKKQPLKSRTESEVYKFKYSYSDKDALYTAPRVSLDFYAGKKENMRKIPVYSVPLKK